MKELIELAKRIVSENTDLPFSIYSSVHEQHITNVPVVKPLLIFVLRGHKYLGADRRITCSAGSFVFLANSPTTEMRNIPSEEEYFALLIPFEYSDFSQFKDKKNRKKNYFQGKINHPLDKALQQFIEWSAFSPKETQHLRRQELLQIIFLAGYDCVGAMAEAPTLSHQIYGIIEDNPAASWGGERIAAYLTMSESTLRRRLKDEGTNIKAIRNRTRLGHGLHLVQTTMEPIGRISERCGYQSQSRFTDQFKQLFSITPSELRKTRLHD
ncbi:AraC family transcriptional regulator [Sinobacterium caligoides]|uniref:AraC family transcriptional regulator n=1 Tax=Sinobacterium caligoides TaxID=933926 RepID=A0A3N2DPA7_9GAMM|nr:AraC family transcriptional regulator [Sinobacterium caligoides]ROS01644.1 AraC family transcriptional regulator [Sinobacterium caligoides]